MSTLEQSAKGKKDGDIRYLTPLNIETNKQKKVNERETLFFFSFCLFVIIKIKTYRNVHNFCVF